MPGEIDLNGSNGGAGGWSEYKRLILSKLNEIAVELKDIQDRLHEIEMDLLGMKIRAGLWGAIAGGLPSLIAALVFWFTKGGGK